MADRSDAQARSLGLNLVGQRGAFVAVRPLKAQLDQFPAAKETVQLGQKGRGQSLFPEADGIGHGLAETTQLGFLGTGE
jgi:hypothetical protein